MVYLFDWTNRQQTKYGQDPKQNSKDRDRQRAKLRFAYKNGTIHNFNQLDNISILLQTFTYYNYRNIYKAPLLIWLSFPKSLLTL